MADGYARSTGQVGVSMVVPGPGMLNGLAGLATAYACSSPLLYIAGQAIRRHRQGMVCCTRSPASRQSCER